MAGNVSDPRRSVVSKVSAIVRAIGEGESHSITDIAARCRLPLSTVHRLVGELAAWRILERDETGRYRPGPPLLLGAGSCCPPSALRDRAAPVMEDLSRVAGAAVRFGVLDGGRVAYLHKTLPGSPVSGFSAAATLPAHATAMGKALLAFSPSAVVELLIARGLTAFTSRTVTRPAELHRMLRLVRASRIAVADGELHPGQAALAAPVFGSGRSVLAAVELAAEDLSRDVERLRAVLAIAAASLSRELSLTACPDCSSAPGGSTGAQLVQVVR